MEKGSATVFVLLTILILTGAGWYFFSKPQNFLPQITRQIATADKTYQNSKFNFELKYQKDLFVKEDSEEEYNKRGNGDFRKNFKGYVGYEPGKFAGAVVILDKSNSYETNPFTVWVFNNDKNLGADEWYKEYWYYPFVWGDFTYKGKVELAPKDEATISGQIGKSGIIDYQPGKPKFIYISKDGKMYLFRIIGEEGNKILSSFKFLNAANSPHEDPWQNYESGQNIDGVTINYPKDWKVNYRKEYNLSSDYAAKHRIDFDFAPPGWTSQGIGWMGWGVLEFDVYDPEKDINQWISKYLSKYKDGLITKKDTQIGNRLTFLLQTDGKKNWSIGWVPRDVILGDKYSYELSHSPNGYISKDGKEGFVTVLEREIYPKIGID